MIDIHYFEEGEIKKGKVEDLGILKLKQIWVDVTHITKEERDLLQNEFDLHPLTSEDLYSSNTRVKVEEFPNYLFCVFYGVEKNHGIHLYDVDMIIGNNFFITNHTKTIESCSNLKRNKEKLEELFKKGPEFLLHHILDWEVDNYFSVLEYVDDHIDSMDKNIAKIPKKEDLMRILQLKQNLSVIRKTVFAQREKVSFLVKDQYKLVSKKALPYFRDVYDHAIRVSDKVDNARESVMNTFDLYMSAVSNNTNEVMKVLSIFATIALPLTVISSIYGTNFLILPGSQFKYGFWIMILIMAGVSVAFICSFKRRGWF